MPNGTPQLPASNIITDQAPFPFSALAGYIKRLIAAAFSRGGGNVVWRPGVPSSGNAFATWAEVVAAVAALDGMVTIALDTDTAAAVVPPGNWDLRPAGKSGPVVMVNGSKAAPFGAPFFTLGPGAVTIHGLTGLDDVSVDNQSTVDVITIDAQSAFVMSKRGDVFQEPGAGAFWHVTATGILSLFLQDFATVTTPGGGTPALTVAAGGTVALTLEDTSAFDVNMMTAAAGVTVSVSPTATYSPQAGAPTIIPAKITQTGSSAIVVGTGKTAAIPVFMSAGARIVVSVKTPVGDANTVKYGALGADRVNGALGSFKISALAAAGGGAVNGVDTSTIDWMVVIG